MGNVVQRRAAQKIPGKSSRCQGDHGHEKIRREQRIVRGAAEEERDLARKGRLQNRAEGGKHKQFQGCFQLPSRTLCLLS